MSATTPTASSLLEPTGAPTPADVRRRARRGLALYLLLTLAGSAYFEWRILRSGKPIGQQGLLVLGLMWTPGLASFVTRLLRWEGLRDISLRFGGWRNLRWLSFAWIYPTLIGALAYGIAWLSGLAQFGFGDAPSRFSDLPGALRFLILYLINASLITVLSAISAAGEEFGWRGYMLTRLVDAGVPRPVLVSGLIWAGWHAPLILSGQYAAGPYPVLSACVFVGSVVAAGYFVARLRLESGSIWPAIAMHAAWNAIIQGVFDRTTRGANIWVGESGLLVAGFSVLFVALFSAGAWSMRRSPRDEPESLAGRPL